MIKCNLQQLIYDWQSKHGTKLSYQTLADEINTSVNFVYRMINDHWKQIDREKLDCLCDFFDCDIGDLLIRVDVEDSAD